MRLILTLRATLPLAAIGIGIGGCAQDVRDVVAESLATENPARARALTGPPPVRPEALAIVPTGLPPTHAPAVAPNPILPKMDEAFKQRRLPPGVKPQTPATQPADHEAPPDGSTPRTGPRREPQNQHRQPGGAR